MTRRRLLASTLAGGVLLVSSLLAAVAPVAAAKSSDVSPNDPCSAARATMAGRAHPSRGNRPGGLHDHRPADLPVAGERPPALGEEPQRR